MKGRNNKTTGIVLLNLGGPDSLEAVRPFLYNLFSDREIIRLGPAMLQKPLAWLISRLRSKKTEEMYRLIGNKSPIHDITSAQARALEKVLNQDGGETSFKVYIGMRYWHPFVDETIISIINDGVKELIVISLYPHYSRATTGSSIDEFRRKIADRAISAQYIEQWYDFPPYIDALAELVFEGITEFNTSTTHLLYSAHSLPRSFIDEGDPYLDHIRETIQRLNIRLSESPYDMKDFKWHLSFQSKTGPVKWLEPSTKDMIVDLSGKGCKNLFVIPISFVSDHIETLYEIDILYRDLAWEHGIELKRCESLNISDNFISAMKELVLKMEKRA